MIYSSKHVDNNIIQRIYSINNRSNGVNTKLCHKIY